MPMMDDSGPNVALLLGEDGGDEAPDSEAPVQEFDHLDEKEIVEHKHKSAEALIAAIKEGSVTKVLKAFESLHGLDHAAWDKEEPDGQGEEEAGELLPPEGE